MKDIAVISLNKQYERRQHIDELFSSYKLDFRYFDAVDKLKVDEVLKKYKLTINSTKLSVGEVACYLSHYCLWQQVLEQGIPFLMVFEDDIYFSTKAKVLLEDLDWLPSNFNIIKLETMYQKVIVNNGTRLPLEHKLCRIKSRHMGAAGYIISQKGAKELIFMTNQLGIDRPVDHMMFNKFLEKKNNEVYQISPAVCIQDKIYNKETIRFSSELEESREALRKLKLKPSINKRITKELARFYQKLLPRNIYYVCWLFINGYKKIKIEYHE